MIPEIGFSNSRNLLMNSRFGYIQRDFNSTFHLSSAYTADRWKVISENTNVLALDPGGQTAQALGQGSYISIARSANGTATDFLRIEQRVERSLTYQIAENKMTVQVKMRRSPANISGTAKVKFFINTAVSADVHTDLLDSSTGFDVILDPIKVGSPSSGEIAISDLHLTDFEIYYATFDIPTGAEKGLSFSIGVVNPSGVVLPNEWYMDVQEAMLTPGSVLPVYKPMGLDIPSAEIMLLQRYYEKSYPIDEPPGTDQGPVGENALFSCVGSSTVQTLNNGGEFKVPKRTKSPFVQIYAYDGTLDRVNENVSGVTFPNPVVANRVSHSGIQTLFDALGGFTIGLSYWYCWTAEDEI